MKSLNNIVCKHIYNVCRDTIFMWKGRSSALQSPETSSFPPLPELASVSLSYDFQHQMIYAHKTINMRKTIFILNKLCEFWQIFKTTNLSQKMKSSRSKAFTYRLQVSRTESELSVIELWKFECDAWVRRGFRDSLGEHCRIQWVRKLFFVSFSTLNEHKISHVSSCTWT